MCTGEDPNPRTEASEIAISTVTGVGATVSNGYLEKGHFTTLDAPVLKISMC